MYKIGIAGAGTVGSAIAMLLREKGHVITGVFSRSRLSAHKLSGLVDTVVCDDVESLLGDAEIIFITTPDSEIADTAKKFAHTGLVKKGQIFFHMSGALSATVLNPLKLEGAYTGSLHPLQSFAGVQRAKSELPGSFFAIEGEQKAVEVAVEIVDQLGGNAFIIKDKDKPLYHLGAVVASNYLVALMHYAVAIYKEIGMDERQALDALLPLVKGTLGNLEEMGPVRSLTGPVSRGDTGTIRCHLKAMEGIDSERKRLYRVLGQYTSRIALKKGSIDSDKAQEIIKIFTEEE